MPGQRFCNDCGAPLAEAPAAPSDRVPQGERKQVTVLFADVKGSMDLAGRMDPEEWSTLMERFFAVLRQGVERFDGHVEDAGSVAWRAGVNTGEIASPSKRKARAREVTAFLLLGRRKVRSAR